MDCQQQHTPVVSLLLTLVCPLLSPQARQRCAVLVNISCWKASSTEWYDTKAELKKEGRKIGRTKPAALQILAPSWKPCLKYSRQREAPGCCMIEVEAKTLWDAGVQVPHSAQYQHPNTKRKPSAHCSCLLICRCYYIT